MARNQAADAQDLYDSRAANYDDSFHPRFARHMIELARPQPGEHVLDLACGTGLVSYNASEAVGATGKVVGVDISTGMLAQAKMKLRRHEPENVEFHCHSITDLTSLEAVKERKFDLITCCSALVLLENPADALRQWSDFLKPGGRLITDVTHPQSLIPGIVFEKAGRLINHTVPWYRLNFEKPEDLSSKMTAAGLSNVRITMLSQEDIPGTTALQDYTRELSNPKILREYEVGEADLVFDAQVDRNATKIRASPPEVRQKAREAFRKQWKAAACENGKVQEIDGVFVGIGWKQ